MSHAWVYVLWQGGSRCNTAQVRITNDVKSAKYKVKNLEMGQCPVLSHYRWCILNKTPRYMFTVNLQDGIQPMWEDGRNKDGGRWLINLNKNQRMTDLDNFWLETVSVRILERPIVAQLIMMRFKFRGKLFCYLAIRMYMEQRTIFATYLSFPTISLLSPPQRS